MQPPLMASEPTPSVMMATLRPRCAAVRAASRPAIPAPTTRTSCVWFMFGSVKVHGRGVNGAAQHDFFGLPVPAHGAQAFPAFLQKLAHIRGGGKDQRHAAFRQGAYGPQGTEGALTGTHAHAGAQAHVIQGIGGGVTRHKFYFGHADHFTFAD